MPSEHLHEPPADGGADRSDALQLGALLNQVPAFIWTIDRDLVLTSHTGSERDPRHPQPGQTLQEAWHLAPDATTLTHHRRALSGEATSYEHHFNGRRFQVHIEPLRDATGAIEGAVGVSVDVTELRRAEEAEHRLAALVASAHHAIYSGDVDGTIRTWNEGAERLFGWAAEEIVGRNAGVLVPDGIVEPDTTGVADGETYRFQSRRLRKDGRQVDVDITVSPILGADGDVLGASVIAHDISERIRARRDAEQALRVALERESRVVSELQELDELKSAFLQAVSHELRTPLTSVLGLAHTIEDHHDQLGSDQVHDLARRLRHNAERLDQLLTDLLDLERLTRSEVTARQRSEDLSQLVEGALADLITDDHPISLALEPAQVQAERRLVERIVENLVRNAQRHTPPGTPIHVRVSPTPDGGLLEVEDEGPGIEPELRSQLFTPFVQGPRARTSPTPGTGIGLSLVDRFTRLQGGRVWVDEADTGGARFSVWLPGPDA